MFILFYIMEKEVRHYYTIYLPENSDHKKAIILNALLDYDDLKHQWAQITTGEDENVLYLTVVKGRDGAKYFSKYLS